MKEVSIHEQPRMLNEILEGLKQASGAASQLIHQTQDARWFVIRDCLTLAQEGITEVATFQARQISTVKPS